MIDISCLFGIRNPLPRALMWAFVAKRDLLLVDDDSQSDIPNDPETQQQILQRLNQSSRLLRDSLMQNKDSDPITLVSWILSNSSKRIVLHAGEILFVL